MEIYKSKKDHKNLNYHTVGKEYWWVKIKQDIVLNLFKSHNINNNALLLDAGCGSGYLLKNIAKKNKTVGIDLDLHLLKQIKQMEIVQGKIEKLPFKNSSFEGIISLDVLEHLEKDTDALVEMRRTLKKNGHIFITVPNSAILWGQHDIMHKHLRRYCKKDLSIKLHEAGFKKIKITVFGWTLYLPLFFYRNLQKIFFFRKDSDDCIQIPSCINKILLFLIKIDYRASDLVKLPFGITAFAEAKK